MISTGVAVFDPLIIRCITSTTLSHLCPKFCSKLSGGQTLIFPINKSHQCQKEETEMRSRLVVIDTNNIFHHFFIDVSIYF